MGFNTKTISLSFVVVALLGALGLAMALTTASSRQPRTSTELIQEQNTTFQTFVHQPEAPQIFTGRTNYAGQAVTVSCASCHATTTPNPTLRDATQLKQFHQGMKLDHGDMTCVSCHNQSNYDTLRLADGTAVEFPNVLQLCGQCHGPQARDFRNGAHGGMTGYWDLTRGARHRNTCTDCHDPHSPAYPLVMPVFKPPPAARDQAPSAKVQAKSDKH